MPHRLAVLGLILTVAAAPMVLDKCAVGCEAGQAASVSKSTPTCHHDSASAPEAHVGHVPVSCGHDHAAAVAAIGGKQDSQGHSLLAAMLAVAGATAHLPTIDGRLGISVDSSQPAPIVSDRRLHLRI